MRLIDADELYEKMETMHQAANGYVLQNAFNVATKYVLDAPTIDPVKHGEWIGEEGEIEGLTFRECNRCHKIRMVDEYCSNCGAKMDGGTP